MMSWDPRNRMWSAWIATGPSERVGAEFALLRQETAKTYQQNCSKVNFRETDYVSYLYLPFLARVRMRNRDERDVDYSCSLQLPSQRRIFHDGRCLKERKTGVTMVITHHQPLCYWWLIWPIPKIQKKLENDWDPGTWVLIWEYSSKAIQWIPTWQGLEDFQKCACPCAVDESSLSIGRVTLIFMWYDRVQ